MDSIKNKKGFTLIEILAVIIILGVLLIVAVPSISKYIENSRKNTYINSVKSMVNAASAAVNAMNLPFSIDEKEGMIIPFSEIKLEKEGATTKSPYSRWVPEKSFILVVFDGDMYQYYVSAYDEAGYGIPLVNDKELSTDSITTDSSVLNSSLVSYEKIKKNPTGVYDLSEMSVRYYKDKENVVKVLIGHPQYSNGDVIQLKDGSKWYATVDSSFESERITLLSYYTMSTSRYGTQNSNNNPIQFHTSEAALMPAVYEEASIHRVAKDIIDATSELLGKHIDMNGATVDMPVLADFGCTVSNASRCKVGNYFKESISFWTSETNGNFVYYISSNGSIGRATTNVWDKGIRIVVRDILKSNIDKQATKELN